MVISRALKLFNGILWFSQTYVSVYRLYMNIYIYMYLSIYTYIYDYRCIISYVYIYMTMMI